MKKTGRWIQHTYLFCKDVYECFNCGYKADKPYKTCPHCGVLMKESKYDPSWVDEVVLIDAILDD